MEASAPMLDRASIRASWLLKLLVVAVPILCVGIQWFSWEVVPGQLLTEVPKVVQLPWLETEWTYLYLHLFTFIPVFALSFDRRVHYYRKWLPLLPAILVVGLLFIAWDVFFTVQQVWGFNEDYFLGVSLFTLPVEEWLFFVTIPFACVFIYECLNHYVKKDWLRPVEPHLTVGMIVLFAIIGIACWGRVYTSTTFLLTSGFLLYHYLFLEVSYRSRFYLSYIVSLFPFLLVNGVLTGGYTEAPVVIYNPDEYLGIRITSVPLDDAVYGFLLMMGVVTLFERFRS